VKSVSIAEIDVVIMTPYWLVRLSGSGCLYYIRLI